MSVAVMETWQLTKGFKGFTAANQAQIGGAAQAMLAEMTAVRSGMRTAQRSYSKESEALAVCSR